jgi:hypothetical protein
MKQGVENTMKFKKLKRRLRLPYWQVVGLLESIWKLGLTSAQAGDVGRYSNEDIAAAIEYEGDADELVGVLVDCEWLDADPEFRLIIHDWSEHVPTYLKGNFSGRKKEFADVIAKQRAKQTAKRGANSEAVSVDANSEAVPCHVMSSNVKSGQVKSGQVKSGQHSPGSDITIPEKVNNPLVVAAVGRWFAYIEASHPDKTVMANSPEEQALWSTLNRWEFSPSEIEAQIDVCIMNGWRKLIPPESPRQSNGNGKPTSPSIMDTLDDMIAEESRNEQF